MKRSILFPARFMTIPQITTASLPNGLQNQPYSFQFTETGGTYPFTWSATITPNTGGQFSLDPVTGILSSVNSPTAETETVTVQVSDAMAPHNVAQASFTFTVNSAVVITTSSLPTATATVPYSATLAATGGVPPYTWAMSPTNADGLTINATTGVLSGTPTTATTQTVTFTATDSTNVPSAPVSLTLTVQATGNQPLPPRAMWSGQVMTTAIMVSWWPPTDVTHVANLDGTIADPNSYNVYQSVNGGPFNRIATGVKPRPHFGIGEFYWFNDGGFNGGLPATAPLLPSTTYAYRVRTASPTGVESVDGPTYTATTRDTNNGSAPPTPVIDPNTWIVADALPLAATRTTWICTDTTINDVPGNDPLGTGTGTRAPNTTITGCSFPHALNNSNPAGGDVIVLTSGATYATPGTGYTLQTYTGANGWTYVISDQHPLYNSSGTLPAYEFSTNVYPTKWTLSGPLAIGARSATLSTNWVKKSGIYEVTFSNKERREVTFNINSQTITWDNGRNPYGWMGTVGPGLASAATATISVVYHPSVTPTDQAAFATLQYGGPSTSGFGITINAPTNNVRFAGIWFKPRPLSSADIGKPGIDSTGTCLNFFGVQFVGGGGQGAAHSDSVYFDRCMAGGNSAAFVTTGPPNYTVVTNTEYGNCIHGIGGVLADHFLAHQCYFQGLQSSAGSTGQDAQAIYSNGGGPQCIQNCRMEAVGESYIAGGTFVPQFNHPHDLTYRYNYSNKPQWWQWAPQTRFINAPSPASKTFIAAAGQTAFICAGSINFTDTWRYVVTVNGLVQDPSTYTAQPNIDPTLDKITFNAAPPTGSTVVIKFGVQYYFGDHVKNLFELKCMINGHIYGNVQQGNWPSLEGGQLGQSMNIGCKDQKSEGGVNSGNYTTFPMNTCPWVQLTDVDVHDNLSIQVAAMSLLIGQSACPTAYLQRIRYKNNMVFIQQNQQGGYQGYAYIPTGTICDLWFENNTFILDPANSSIAASAIATFDYTTPNAVWEHETIINNVTDAPLMVVGDSAGGMNTLISSGKMKYLVLDRNLTVNDTGTTLSLAGGTNYYHVPYTSVGFANFGDNLHPPVVPSDWNIVSGPYAVGSTTGGPVGATLEGFDPVGLFLGNSLQGIILQLQAPPAGGNAWLEFIGTDAKYGNVLPRQPASPWGGGNSGLDAIQQVYNVYGDYTEAIATDNTVPSGVSNQVRVTTAVNPVIGTIQDSYLVFPNQTTPQGMLYTSHWMWLQADLPSRTGGHNVLAELMEFKTQPTNTERFQWGWLMTSWSGFGATTPCWFFLHDDKNTDIYLESVMNPNIGGALSFGQTYAAPFPLGRWFKVEWAFNRKDSAGQGWMWAAITDPGSTDANLRAGQQIFAARGPFNWNDNGTIRTLGLNETEPTQLIFKLFLDNTLYGNFVRSSGSVSPNSPYVAKATDYQVYARWPSTATAHPSNYL